MLYDIVVRDLHYAYPPARGGGEAPPVLRGVNLQVRHGEFVALLGRVGAGKTTLCMALNGLVPHATGGRFRGDVLVVDQNTRHHAVPDLARLVGLVFQDPETQLTQMRVEDEIAFGLENLGLPPAEIEKRVAWALDVVGLSACGDRSPLLLSGGQKQRVAIAAMLAMQPRVLVLDEPTASLDPRARTAVYSVLAELSQTRRMTIFLATQELEWIPRFADRVLVLQRGTIALEGQPADVLGQAETLQEWGIGVPQMVETAHLLRQRTGRAYHFITASEAYRLLRQEARLAPSARSDPGSQVRPLPPARPRPTCVGREPTGARATDRPEIRVESVSYTYRDGTAALNDVSLTLPPGEFVALVGPNGSGKTTLAKHINGLLKPTAGRVLVGEVDTRTVKAAQLAGLVGYVFQNPDHQIFAPTVQEEVAFGPRMQGLPDRAVAWRVADALDRFRLTGYADAPPATLGYAQRRQVALASVLAVQPDVLILDEPSGGLDARSRQQLMAAVAGHHAAGRTIVLITHDMPLVAEYAARVVVLVEGRVLFDGSTPEFFSRRDVLGRAGLAAPPAARLAARLAPYGLSRNVLTPADFAAAWHGRPVAARRMSADPHGSAGAAQVEGPR